MNWPSSSVILLFVTASACALPEKSIGGNGEMASDSGGPQWESTDGQGQTSTSGPGAGGSSSGESPGRGESDTDGSNATAGGTAPQTSGGQQLGGQGDECSDDDHCGDGLRCGVFCEDWCDQRFWPNECCTAYCTAIEAAACIEGVGVEIAGDTCPDGFVMPLDPNRFAAAPDYTCCMQDHCMWGRGLCEVSPVCTWSPDGGDYPNSGNCDPL